MILTHFLLNTAELRIRKFSMKAKLLDFRQNRFNYKKKRLKPNPKNISTEVAKKFKQNDKKQ